MDNDIIIQKIAELSTKVDVVFGDIAELYKKYETLAKDSNDNNTITQTILVKLEILDKGMNKINTGLEELKEAPANKWNDVIKLVIAGIAGLAFGYIGMRLGISK